MNRSFQTLALTVATTLSLAAIAPASQAETLAAAPSQNVRQTIASPITPANLVYLAYQGQFQTQGTPSYQGLLTGYQSGRIQAQDLVQSGVKAGLISEQTATNSGYVQAVEQQLQTLSNIH
ncbi:MAG: hypothetical protein SFW36_06700 [Leptolyngbyaceae cyanobacterium bins.59]|nr:hypothetical protein [Leptolyngbyaceae cyanobacterium bins.59]